MARPTPRSLPLAARALLLGSGCAALIYQVVWVRLLRLSLGSTSASVSTVLAAFFLGLALGSWLSGRLGRSGAGALRLFLGLESTIALCGLALLPLLLHQAELVALLPGSVASLPGRFGLTLALLLLPTLCMGATLPVLAGVLVRRQEHMASRLSSLYGLNTAGAVAGAALSGFVLVPRLGLDGANAVAVALNLTVVALGFAARGRLLDADAEPEQELGVAPELGAASEFTVALADNPANGRAASEGDAPTGAASTPGDPASSATATATAFAGHTREPSAAVRRLALPFLFATGLTSLATEVGWTRVLAILTGSTLYGLSAILAVFLAGIALGAWAIRRRLDRLASPATCLALGAALAALALLGTRAGLSTVPLATQAFTELQVSPWQRSLGRYGYVGLLVIAPTFLFGALFPLALSLYCGRVAALPRRMGAAMAVNTCASILGSLCAGFWWIPTYGTDAMLLGCAVLLGALPLVALPALPSAGARVAVVTLVALVGVGAATLPGIDLEDLITSVRYAYDDDAHQGTAPEYLFLAEAETGVISVVSYDGKVAKLQNNGLNEAWIHLHDPRHGVLAETLLGLVPSFVHRDPRSALVIGLGGGTTVRALSLAPLESLRVVELEPMVVEAVTSVVSAERLGLDDPRVTLVVQDARHTLLTEERRYDLIVSQPSHPWLAGAANLFTQEFFELVRRRLGPGGVFGQWVNLFKMDAVTLRSLLAAFYRTFPHGFALAVESSGDLLLFGSSEPLAFDHEVVAGRMCAPDIRARLEVHRIRTPDDLLARVTLSRAEALAAAGDAEPNTDLNILTEVRLADLGPELTPEQDPVELLHRAGRMDLAELLPADQLAERLHAVGLSLLERGPAVRLDAVIDQLRRLAPALAEELSRPLAEAGAETR